MFNILPRFASLNLHDEIVCQILCNNITYAIKISSLWNAIVQFQYLSKFNHLVRTSSNLESLLAKSSSY